MQQTRKILGLVAAMSLAALSASALAQSKVTLRLTSASPPQMEDSKALVETAEFLKKESNGTVILRPFFSAALFGEVDGIGAAQNGLVDMAVACTCNLTKLTSAFLFADLPYTFKTTESGRKVWSGPVGERIKDVLEKDTNLVALAFAPSGGGHRLLLNNKKKAKVPADIAGMKIRTTATPLEQEFWKQAGAVPTPIDISETYSALQQGVVDAEHLQPMWTEMLKHDEVTKHATEIGALLVYRTIVINDKALKKLDASQKEALAKAMAYFEERAYHYNNQGRETSLEAIRKHGVDIYNPTPEELAQWEALGKKFRNTDMVKKAVPADLVEQVLAAQEGN